MLPVIKTLPISPKHVKATDTCYVYILKNLQGVILVNYLAIIIVYYTLVMDNISTALVQIQAYFLVYTGTLSIVYFRSIIFKS